LTELGRLSIIGAMSAHSRFAKWLEFLAASDSEVARRLGCDATYPGKIRSGRRTPGLDVAHAIEKLSTEWPEGPIRTEEWIEHSPTVITSDTDTRGQ